MVFEGQLVWPSSSDSSDPRNGIRMFLLSTVSGSQGAVPALSGGSAPARLRLRQGDKLLPLGPRVKGLAACTRFLHKSGGGEGRGGGRRGEGAAPAAPPHGSGRRPARGRIRHGPHAGAAPEGENPGSALREAALRRIAASGAPPSILRCGRKPKRYSSAGQEAPVFRQLEMSDTSPVISYSSMDTSCTPLLVVI